MGSSRLLWWVFPLMIVLISGCSPRNRVSPDAPLQSASLQDLVARLDERTKSIQTLKALVTIRPEGQPSVTASLSLSRMTGDGPPSLRLKGFDPLGRTLFDLISVGDKVRLTLPAEGRVLESGPDGKDDPSLPIQAAELRLTVSALIGPFIEPGEVPVIERVGTNYLIHLVRVMGAEGRLTKRFWFERSHLRLELEELFREKEDAATRVEFYDYRSLSGIDWPGRVTVTRPTDGFHVTLEFREVHLNSEILPEEFRIP